MKYWKTKVGERLERFLESGIGISPYKIGCFRFWKTLPRYTVLETKFFFQRRIRGYDDSDLWSLDTHIARHLHKVFRDFRKGGLRGYPVKIRQEYGLPVDESSEHTDKKASFLWEEHVLKSIEEGFEIYATRDWYDRTPEDEEKIERAKEYFCEYFECFWD